MRGNGAASSSRPLLTQYTGRNWLNAKIVESSEGVRCRPAHSSADVCQRGTVRQRMGGGNTPGGVSPHPQGAWLALRLVRQGDGLHYPVGQPLFGDSLPFLLPSVADKELLGASDAPGAGHVYGHSPPGPPPGEGVALFSPSPEKEQTPTSPGCPRQGRFVDFLDDLGPGWDAGGAALLREARRAGLCVDSAWGGAALEDAGGRPRRRAD